MKQNKCQKNAKKCGKNIFNVYLCLDKNIKTKSKGKKSKITKISQNGPGGCMCKTVVQKGKITQAQPKEVVFNL